LQIILAEMQKKIKLFISLNFKQRPGKILFFILQFCKKRNGFLKV